MQHQNPPSLLTMLKCAGRFIFHLNSFLCKQKFHSALQFGLQLKPFESWLTIITLTRNACCHHTRVWNKQNSIIPMEPKVISKSWIKTPVSKLRIYYDLCIIKWFLNCISPNNDLTNKIIDLLNKFPNMDIKAMGFPTNWLEEELWQIN